MIFFLIAQAFAVVCDDPVDVQDLNCNNVPEARETPVDLTDPVCAASVDDAGETYPNADYYYDYTSFGCQFLIAGYDVDGDGLSYAELSFPEGCEVCDLKVVLLCDNCPALVNPLQE